MNDGTQRASRAIDEQESGPCCIGAEAQAIRGCVECESTCLEIRAGPRVQNETHSHCNTHQHIFVMHIGATFACIGKGRYRQVFQSSHARLQPNQYWISSTIALPHSTTINIDPFHPLLQTVIKYLREIQINTGTFRVRTIERLIEVLH